MAHIFVFDSHAFYDSHWDAAHLIVLLSYFPLIFGVWGETIKLHKSAQVQAIELEKEMTERKQFEEALKIDEALFRELYNNMKSGSAIFSVINDGSKGSDYIIKKINRAGLEMEGKALEEVVGKRFIDIRPAIDSYGLIPVMKKVWETGESAIFPAKIYIDELYSNYYENYIFKLPSGEVVTLYNDVTESKMVEEVLRKSEERFKVIASSTPDHIFMQDNELRYTLVINPQLGLTEQDMIGKTDYDFLSKEEADKFTGIKRQVIESGEPQHIETSLISKDGKQEFFDGNYVPRFNANGKVDGLIGYFRNVTERKKADEAILSAAREWSASFDAMSDGVSIHSADYTILNVNQSLCQMLGKTADEIIGGKCYQIFHGTDGPIADCPFKILKETNKKTSVEIYEPKLNKWISVSTSPIFDASGSLTKIVHTVRDTTEHRTLEEQLRHSQKMEAIGTLAGGIAHDFNNILTAIIGYASVMQMKMFEDDPLSSHLEQILTSSERAAVLTQSLLAFSRKQISMPAPVDLNEIVKKAEKILSRVIGEDIELKIISADMDLTVMVDAGQIEQVLMNLATNARDAMPKGGALTIQTEPVEFDSEFINAFGYGDVGKYACIIVSDTGVGIDASIKENIFEPFFTTKEVGKGTGLGLSMVYGIIKQHNGYINCYSESGKGTTFKIYLPLFGSMPVSKTVTEWAAVAAPTGGTETILVAEDEESVRKLMKEALEEYGYKVIEAADGEEAVSKFKQNKDRIDLLLLDIVMPKMSAREVYERIKKIKPDIKLLMASGYPADYISKNGIIEEGFNFIVKPMSPTNLLKKVRETLDK